MISCSNNGLANDLSRSHIFRLLQLGGSHGSPLLAQALFVNTTRLLGLILQQMQINKRLGRCFG